MKEIYTQYKVNLEKYLNDFEIFINRDHYLTEVVMPAKKRLQRDTILIANIVNQVHGGGGMTINNTKINFRQAIDYTLTGTISEGHEKFAKSHILLTLNQAIGNIVNGTIPSKIIEPILPIKDEELKNRCLELLSKPGHFDTAVREATLVLEARLKNSVPNETLAVLIPSTVNINFENLVNNLLAPSNPVLVISSDPKERVAFHKIMLGVGAYLRNPFHHNIDDQMEWSWAWSIVGFIDHLLFELGKCEKRID